MYRLAIRGEKLHRGPAIETDREQRPEGLLRARSVRGGKRPSAGVCAQPVATFMYETGWRLRSEVLPLMMGRQVDFTADRGAGTVA